MHDLTRLQIRRPNTDDMAILNNRPSLLLHCSLLWLKLDRHEFSQATYTACIVYDLCSEVWTYCVIFTTSLVISDGLISGALIRCIHTMYSVSWCDNGRRRGSEYYIHCLMYCVWTEQWTQEDSRSIPIPKDIASRPRTNITVNHRLGLGSSLGLNPVIGLALNLSTKWCKGFSKSY